MTQRTASTRLDLPQPFGPTTPVSPGSMTKSVGSTKDLKPIRRSRVSFIRVLFQSPKLRPRRESLWPHALEARESCRTVAEKEPSPFQAQQDDVVIQPFAAAAACRPCRDGPLARRGSGKKP